MAHRIDLNRGVTMRYTSEGVEVFMYKDTPGVFLNAFGTEVSRDLAAKAGFPVDLLINERRKRERMAEAGRVIEEQFNMSRVERKVVAERAGWKVVSLGLGRHQVLDPEGSPVNAKYVTLEEAQVLLNSMVPTEPEKPAEPEPTPEPKPKPKPKPAQKPQQGETQ